MINGTLPNNTVWWISRDGKKVWIESRELENQKFIDKEYDIEKDRIFASKPKRQIGELTGSRLEGRLYKDSWRITLDSFLDIYPELVTEIDNKRIAEKKKKRQTKSKTESNVSKVLPQKEIEKKKTDKGEINKENVQEDVQEKKEEKIKIEMPYFDITRPYMEWIKEEIYKSPNGELIILSDDMKEKMGKEYTNMHIMRIYFGLKKVLSEIGINVDLGAFKGKSALIFNYPALKAVASRQANCDWLSQEGGACD